MDTLVQDLRYAVRTLARSPGFALLSVLCLSLGIGVNTTIFSVVDTVAIRPLPFRDPEALVSVRGTHGRNRGGRVGNLLAGSSGLQERHPGLCRSRGGPGPEHDRHRPRRVGTVSRLVRLLESLPVARGRSRARPALPGRRGRRRMRRAWCCWATACGSAGTWATRRSSGAPITVDGQPHTVVGVMPPSFQFPELSQLWRPVAPVHHASRRDERFLNVVGRLAPGMSIDDGRRGFDRLRRTPRGLVPARTTAGARPRSRSANS